jgi:crossover junction endodeoxyribonuclease RuvC
MRLPFLDSGVDENGTPGIGDRGGNPERPVARSSDVRVRPYPSFVKVLGIDPGTAACGFGIVHESEGRIRAITHGVWQTSARERPERRLRTIFDGVQGLVREHAPDAVALEESFVGADARIALFVGQARGAVLVAAALDGLEFTEYEPARVKQTVCGYGRADKAQMQRMVRIILGLPAEPPTSHAADALAVALCHALAPPLARVAS